MTKRRSVRSSWPILLALVLLGLFWCLYGLAGAVQMYRFAGVGPEAMAVVVAAIPTIALITGFGVAHLIAAYGLWVGRGWAIVLAAVLSVLGLVAFGLAARWVISMMADTSASSISVR